MLGGEQEVSSTSTSIISLSKTIIGAGLLSMPLAYATDGFVGGTLMIMVAAATSGFGLWLQGYVARFVPAGRATFFSICSITYPSLSVVFDFAIAIQCFGCAVSYLILIGDLMPTIVKVVPRWWVDNVLAFWIIVSGFACIPLSFLRNLASLRYTSILGLGAISYMSLLVIVHFFMGDVPGWDKGEFSLTPPTLSGVFSTFSIIVFAFTGHQNMFSIINEEKDKSLTHITFLINFVILLSSTLFIIVGLAGYATFGDKVGGNIILEYPEALSTTIGRLSIVIMVVFSFPLMIHPARISVNNIYNWGLNELQKRTQPPPNLSETSALLENDRPSDIGATDSPETQENMAQMSDNVFNVITMALLLLGYFLAITIKSFALVLAVVGATGSTSISFILPGLFGYKLMGQDSAHPLTKQDRILKHLSLALVVWGLCVMILCLYTSLANA